MVPLRKQAHRGLKGEGLVSAIYCNIRLIYLGTHDGNIHLQPAPSGWYR